MIIAHKAVKLLILLCPEPSNNLYLKFVAHSGNPTIITVNTTRISSKF